MDKQSQEALTEIVENIGRNNFTWFPMGGPWNPDSPFAVFKTISTNLVGQWGEKMFEKTFGMKSEPTGLDLPILNADIKTFTRATDITKFSGFGNQYLKPDYYFMYLIFPNEYQLYCVPQGDKSIKEQLGVLKDKGKIDVTGVDIERFIENGYDSFSLDNLPKHDNNLEKFFS